MQKKGTHGTCVSCAEIIERSGFQMSSGRGGEGVYLWRQSELAADLARGWYQFCFDKGKYRHYQNPSCAVICASMNVAEDELLDLEDPEIKDKIYQIMKRLDILPHPSDDAIAAAHDLFVSEIETTLRKKIKILELRVGLPTGYFTFYDLRALGAPVCYIARDSKIIVIDAIGK